MPSSYSASARLTLQATGENLNTWGVILNNGVFQLVDALVCGRLAFSLSGSKVLSTANGAADEARNMILDVTGGTGGTITIPSVSKVYVVRNGAGGDVILTTGGGSNANIRAGNIGWVFCDGASCRALVSTDMGGQRITNVGAPVVGSDAATKAYVDGVAFNSTNLPGQGPGSENRPVISNGVSASWGGAQMLRTATTGIIHGETSTGSKVGGLFGDTATGELGFVNAAGQRVVTSIPQTTRSTVYWSNAAGVRLGGAFSDSVTGETGFIDGAGDPVLVVDAAGDLTIYDSGGNPKPVGSPGLAIAMALYL